MSVRGVLAIFVACITAAGAQELAAAHTSGAQDRLTDRARNQRSWHMDHALDNTMIGKSAIDLTAHRTNMCSINDQEAINTLQGGNVDNSFPAVSADCAHDALDLVNGIEPAAFHKCLSGHLGPVSVGCSDCFAGAAQYGFEYCKQQCMLSWCSTECLECAAGFHTNRCTGFNPPQPTACAAPLVEELSAQAFPSVISPVALIGVFAGTVIVAVLAAIIALLRRSEERQATAAEEPLLVTVVC